MITTEEQRPSQGTTDSEAQTAPQDTAPLISFKHAHKVFTTGTFSNKQQKIALNDVSLDIYEGDIFGIIGFSGAGKSTLLRLINGLEKPTSGSVTVFGNDITHYSESQLRPIRQKIGMIFQQFNLFSSKTVAQNVEYPLIQDNWRKDFRQKRVDALLAYVGLSDFANSYPDQLSGGQKQRVGIARALALQPKILLADEATSALDPQTTDEVLSLLLRVNRELGITVVLITHQMSVVSSIAQRVCVMETGKVVEAGNVYSVFARPQQPITRTFVASAINTIPSEETIAQLRSKHAGRLLTVIMRDADATNGIADSGTRISAMLTHRNITNNILCGGVDPVAGKSLGSFTYELYGDADQMDSYIAQLAQANTVVDFGSADNPIAYAQACETAIALDEARCTAYMQSLSARSL